MRGHRPARPYFSAPPGDDDVDASTVVRLSGLGLTIAAVSGFQAGVPAASGRDPNGIEAEAAALIEAFNRVEARLADAADATGDPLPARLAADLAAAVRAPFFDGASAFTELARVGIAFEAAASGIGGALTLDAAALAAAWAADPGGTRSLLSGAFAALSTVLARHGRSGGAIPTAIAASRRRSAASTVLSGATILPGAPTLADFLVLESLNRRTAGAARPDLALGQFRMVHSLAGAPRPMEDHGS